MNVSMQLAAILGLGIAAQWIAWRLKLPAIVLLLGFGVAWGRFYSPADLLGNEELLFSLVSLAVGIILFEGGLSLDFREIRETRGVVLRLVTVGLVVTWLATAALAHWVAGFSMDAAILLGAVLTVSGPTVVLPLLRHVQPVRRIGSLMKWEGIVNDPIGAVLAALVFEVVVHRQHQDSVAGASLAQLGLTVLVGVLLGGLGALFVQQMLKRFWVPDYLQNPIILALVLAIFALSNRWQHESGLVTVTLMGVFLANQRKVAIHHVVEFKENLRVLLISMLFIVLAARLDVAPESLAKLGWGSVAFVAMLILLVRPLSVLVSTIGSPLTTAERIFLAWIHPRGIVAAAVSSLLSLEIVRALGNLDPLPGLATDAQRLELVVFLVIVVTVTVYGLTLAPLARRLGLSGENPQGILFVGASRGAREIAKAIQAENHAVLLVDTNREHTRAARMAGLPVTHASIGSEYVQEEIDLGGIGRLLAMTPNDEVNTLAAIGFVERFGRAGVYQVAADEDSNKQPAHQDAYRGGRTLFDPPLTIGQLEARLSAGAVIKKTLLTDDFSLEDFRARYSDSAVMLLVVDEAGQLRVATSDSDTTPKAGDKVIALVNNTNGNLPASG
jgi:NhaP-type Na+/H+ or K+/H+ antiporter